MDSKISVVVTCYNHEAYIEECLRSIFEQTHHNIELLIFNDGSEDQSDLIIKKLLSESPFESTDYFSDANQGISKVRNLALTKITGDFLLFVDSDDFLNPNHIEQLLFSLEENEADIAYCQLWDFENEKDALRQDLDFSLAKELEGNLISASSLIRGTVIKDARFDEQLQNLEDYDFWLNLILNHQAKPIFVEQTKLNYRVVENSRSSRNDFFKYYQSYFHIINKYRKEIPEEIIEALQKNVLGWVESYQTLDNNRIQQLFDKDTHINSQEKTIEELRNSQAYRLGMKILHPFRKQTNE